MTEVLLVRHGEAVQEAGDPGLTAVGADQASRVATALAASDPAAVVTSPLLRARATAEPIAHAAGLVLGVDARLRERMNRDGGMRMDRFLAEWRRTEEDRDRVPEGVSDARSSTATGRDLLEAVVAHAVPNRTVILVTHGGAVLDLLRTLLGDEELVLRTPGLAATGIPNASVTRLISTDGEAWSPAGSPDVRHLLPAGSDSP